MTIPAIVNHKTIYYIVTYWTDKTKSGNTLKNAYKTEKGALKKAQAMLESNLYDSIMVRKETVWKRDANNEFSTSSPYKLFERQV